MALVAAALLSTCLPCAGGEIFRWKDAQGVVHYSDRPDAGVAAEPVQLRPDPPPAAIPAQSQPLKQRPMKPGVPADPVPLDIVMYVMPNCGYCAQARNHFRARGVAWQEIDITASRAAANDFKAHGGTGTPLVYINGGRFQGWNPEGYDRALARLGYP